ncbi:hypothetical protein DPMN_180582 [Dreissena polymorpha]|uniref:Uncharacterized protein n=1 Tax=Dreissena polymorpha TaxID=45954 RepID=A0A9D4IPH7_DREPO|nr:hypothetical protein DPMN_180582 [Dreissena polymorpha]
MIEKQSSVRKQQTETAGKVVLDNMSKAKNKKRKFNQIHIGASVLKFNASRAARKAKGNLESNYTGPYVVDNINGNIATLKTMSEQVLKSGVSLNNLKIFVESAVELAEKCLKLQTGVSRVNKIQCICSFTEKLSVCPVSSFINEALKLNQGQIY